MLLGFLAGGITGILLGLLGGGGSIIAVPSLIYILGMSTKSAIGTSLCIVGLASLIAALSHFSNRSVDLPTAVWFGSAGVVGSLLGSWIGQLIPDSLQLYMFAILMAVIAVLLLKKRERQVDPSQKPENRSLKVLAGGALAGILTGVLGVGGGFIIVPILILVLRMPPLKAIGTSLLVISFNSIAGTISYLPHLRWDLSIAGFATATVFFAYVCGRYAHRIPQQKLQTVFAYSLIFISVFMVVKQSLN